MFWIKIIVLGNNMIQGDGSTGKTASHASLTTCYLIPGIQILNKQNRQQYEAVKLSTHKVRWEVETGGVAASMGASLAWRMQLSTNKRDSTFSRTVGETDFPKLSFDLIFVMVHSVSHTKQK